MTSLNATAFKVSVIMRTMPREVSDFFTILCLNTVGEIVGIIGIAANIVNIRIFVKQGFRESINITFTALAITDLGALLTLQIINLLVSPWSLTAKLDFAPFGVATLLSFYPHNYFVRVSGLITAFASFERCLGVVFPLKIKKIINRKRILVGIFGMYILASLNVIVPYTCSYLDWKVLPGLNTSYFGIVSRDEFRGTFNFSYFYTDLFLPHITFFTLIASNVIMGVQLRARATWRKGVTSKSEAKLDRISRPEKKIIQMLTAISMIFIVCLIPQSTMLTVITFVRDFGLGGSYFDVAWFCYCVSFFLETVHSSVNIIVFYRMSSRYRAMFQELFRPTLQNKKKLFSNLTHKIGQPYKITQHLLFPAMHQTLPTEVDTQININGSLGLKDVSVSLFFGL